MIKLRLLRYFKAVVELGSISAASQVLFVAQPPLSKALQQLEQEWNVQLFERSSRGMIPTQAGLYLYRRSCDLLQLAGDIDEEMHAFGGGARGVVRIGTVSMGIPRVTAVISALRSSSPQISFSLYQGDTRYLEELLERQRIDIALVHLPLSNSENELSIASLAHANFRALCRADHPLVGNTFLTLQHLAPYPLILMRRKSGFGVYDNIVQQFRKQQIKPKILADASDVPMMQALVAQGLGIGLMPVLPDEQQWGELCTLPVPELEHAADDLVLAYRSSQSNAMIRTVVAAFTAPLSA
jgi:DNA-binding transcriptional LysR family regulator